MCPADAQHNHPEGQKESTVPSSVYSAYITRTEFDRRF
jgi:hypothetical protein